MGTTLNIDGAALRSEADLHDVIEVAAGKVGFVGYGRNLNAMDEVLTTMLEPPVHVVFSNTGLLEGALGQRAEAILQVFRDAAEELGERLRLEVRS